eukprot:UN06387
MKLSKIYNMKCGFLLKTKNATPRGRCSINTVLIHQTTFDYYSPI